MAKGVILIGLKIAAHSGPVTQKPATNKAATKHHARAAHQERNLRSSTKRTHIRFQTHKDDVRVDVEQYRCYCGVYPYFRASPHRPDQARRQVVAVQEQYGGNTER